MKLDSDTQAIVEGLLTAMERPDSLDRISYVAIGGSLPCQKWSINNQIICWLNGTNDARGYKMWAEVGRRVKAGSAAFHILAPLMGMRPDKEGEVDGTVKMVPYLRGFKRIPVFRYEDTEGQAIPEVKRPEAPPLLDVAARLGVTVDYSPAGGWAWGSFSQDQNRITLYCEDAKVFFHELGHAAHAKVERLKGGQDADQEVIAEFIAAVLAKMYGAPGLGNAYDYIARYAASKKKEPIAMVMGLMTKVGKILKVIFPPVEVEA